MSSVVRILIVAVLLVSFVLPHFDALAQDPGEATPTSETNSAGELEAATDEPAPPPPPTEVPADTPVPPEAATETPVPPEVPTATPVPPEVPTDTPVPPEVATDTPVPPEVATDTPVPPEVATDTPVPPEVATDTPVPTEAVESPSKPENEVSTPVPSKPTSALNVKGAAVKVVEPSKSGDGVPNMFVTGDTKMADGVRASTKLDASLGQNEQGVVSQLLLRALKSSFGGLGAYRPFAMSKILAKSGANYSIESLVSLVGRTTKQASVVQIIADYDLTAGTVKLRHYEPNYIPLWPVPSAKAKTMSAEEQVDLLLQKGTKETSPNPTIRDNPNKNGRLDTKGLLANALVCAPISGEDPAAGTAADWIAWWLYWYDGLSVDKYTYPNADADTAGAYLGWDGKLWAWYSNSHGVTANSNGANCTGLVYNSTAAYPWNGATSYLNYDLFWAMQPYYGLYQTVAYVDACNSMMYPLSTSIIANSPRTYIGGMKLMPFGTSDNADNNFWYFTCVQNFNMSTALWAAMYYNGLLGYYGLSGYSGTF